MKTRPCNIFHGCKNDDFQMKNCDVFSSPEPKAQRCAYSIPVELSSVCVSVCL